MKTLNNYNQWLKRKNLSPHTVGNYLQAVRLYGTKQLNTANLCKYIKDNLPKYEPTSWRTKLNSFAVYAKFQKLKIHWQKVAKLIPKIQKKFRITINEQELVRLKQVRTEATQNLYERNNLILDFLFYSRVRVSELVNIKYQDWEENSLRIHGKGNQVRSIFLPPFLANCFDPYRKGYLFLTEEGKPMIARTINLIILQRTKAAGIQKRISPHTFRRSLATSLYNRGSRLETISKQLGHKNQQTTLGYIHNDYNTLYQDYSKIFQEKPSQDQSLRNFSTTELLAEISQRAGGNHE